MQQSQPPKKLKVNLTKERTIKATKCIAYAEVLEKLLAAAVGHSCKECDDWLTFKHIKIGTCLVIKWTCPNGQAGHSSGSWASQPMLSGMYAGNLLVPTALILSGNNFTKVALMAKFLNLNFISKASFFRLVYIFFYFYAVHCYFSQIQSFGSAPVLYCSASYSSCSYPPQGLISLYL